MTCFAPYRWPRTCYDIVRFALWIIPAAALRSWRSEPRGAGSQSPRGAARVMVRTLACRHRSSACAIRSPPRRGRAPRPTPRSRAHDGTPARRSRISARLDHREVQDGTAARRCRRPRAPGVGRDAVDRPDWPTSTSSRSRSTPIPKRPPRRCARGPTSSTRSRATAITR